MSESIKFMLPTVTFRPSGAEHFHALLTLMVGTHVEITYVQFVPVRAYNVVNDPTPPTHALIKERRGEITYVTDDVIYLKPYGLPKRYKPGDYRDFTIDLVNVRMIEVIG